MRARFRARIATVMAAVAVGVVGLTAAPAEASVGGDVINQLSSAYTVKVARFGQGSEGCYTWNYDMQDYNFNTYTCQTWWLPAGQDTETLFGWWSDTDGFTIENHWYYVQLPNHSTRHVVGAGNWTKITNNHNVICRYNASLDAPLCGKQ